MPAASSAPRSRICAARPASPADLAEMYDRWGEYAETPGFDLAAWVTHCIAHPAARKQDTDYAALEP